MKKLKQPLVDISECSLCDICIDICPNIFIKNDSGYIEVSKEIKQRLYDDQGNIIDSVLFDDIQDAVKNCRGDCISWDEEAETENI